MPTCENSHTSRLPFSSEPPGKNSRKRLREIWAAMEKHHIDAVICAEHTFKNAPNAYRRLVAAQPAHMRTHVFPGAELATKGGPGIDIIAFGMDDWYDRHPRLLEPFSMSLRQMLSYLEQSELSYFVPHPYLIKNPLKEFYSTDEEMRTFLASVPAYEAFNGCYLNLENICRMPLLRRCMGRAIRLMAEASHPSPHRLPARANRFIAVGSDAHHPRDIGLSVGIPCARPLNRRDVFTRLTGNTNIQDIRQPSAEPSLRSMLFMSWTALLETATRRGLSTWNAVQALLEDEPEALLLPDASGWLGDESSEAAQS